MSNALELDRNLLTRTLARAEVTLRVDIEAVRKRFAGNNLTPEADKVLGALHYDLTQVTLLRDALSGVDVINLIGEEGP